MKHYLITAIIMALSFVPSIARAYDFSAVNEEGVELYYNILSEEEKTCEVTYMGEDIDLTGIFLGYISITHEGSLIIPQMANGYKVVSIGYSAFVDCSGLTSVVVPSSVTTIKNEAFEGCTSLTSVTIEGDMTSIGGGAFGDCSSLTSISIEGNVTSIGSGAFSRCKKLSSFRIPESITCIDFYTFWGCSELNTIYIPSSVKSIGDGAFYGCNNLQKVIIEDITSWCNMKYFYPIDGIEGYSNPFVFGGSLYSDENTKITNLVIPNTVKAIYSGTFGCGNGITSITIPSGVTIGSYTFSGFTDLTSVTIENGLTSLADGLFSGCSSLTNITIPNGVTTIGTDAFYGCSGLTNITIPNGVTTIGAGAFYGCSDLTSITIPNSVTTIEKNAFQNCSSLTSVEIPSSITTINERTFNGCSQLKTIIIPNSVKDVGIDAFDGTAWYEDHPDGIVYAGENVYKYKGTPTDDTSVVIEDGTKRICGNAFSNCKGITSVTIPGSVTSIGNSAFANCANLSTIYSEITDFFDIDKSVFKGSENTTLYVPKGMATTYRSSTGWSVIKYIEEMPDDTPDASFLISCSNRGSVSINGAPSITNKIAASDINENTDNTFTFTPKPGCKLDQVILNGLDITANVEGNTLTCTIPANSQMIVTFTSEQGDLNNDGRIDISDVVSIVNKVLGIQ